MKPHEKKTFEVSAKDAKRICEALEFCADWDKTEIYYELKNWLKADETSL